MDDLKIYEPGRHLGWGFRVWREMISELVQARGLIWRLFVRDFSARYRQTALGVAWAALMPALMVLVFLGLRRSGLFSVGDLAVPYAAFALWGLTLWQIFAGGLTAASNSIVSGGSMVVKINFPRESLVIASLGQTLVETGVRLALVAVVFAYYKLVPPWTALWLPLAVAPLIILTLGLGLMMALLNALLRDVANMVTLLTLFLLFLTPVLYAEPSSGPIAALTRYNPLAYLVMTPRDLLLTGGFAHPVGFALSAGLAVAMLLFSWRVFHLAESRMVQTMGAR